MYAILAVILAAAVLAAILFPKMATAAATAVGLWPYPGSGEIHFIDLGPGGSSIGADETAGPTWKAPWVCRVVKCWANIVAHTAQTTVATDIDVAFKNGTGPVTIATVAVVDTSAIVAAGGVYESPASAAAALVAKGDVLEAEWDFTSGSGTQTATYPKAGLWVERLSTGV